MIRSCGVGNGIGETQKFLKDLGHGRSTAIGDDVMKCTVTKQEEMKRQVSDFARCGGFYRPCLGVARETFGGNNYSLGICSGAREVPINTISIR